MPPNKKKKSPRKLIQTILTSSPSSSPRKAPANRSTAPRKRRKLENDSDSDSEHVSAVKFEPKRTITSKKIQKQSDSESSDSEQPVCSPVKAKSRRQIVLSDDEASQSNEPPSKKRRRLRRDKSPTESASGNGASTKTRRQRLKHAKSRKDDSSSDDLEQEHVLSTRLRTPKKTKFQKNLEKLKRKKQGKPMSSSSEGDDSDSSDPAPIPGAKPDEDRDSLFDGSGSDSESNFIVEDDGEQAELPLQFQQQEDLAHQFKKVFQFFVHIAVQEPDERRIFMQDAIESEEYFRLPLYTFRRKLAGMKDSAVTSSVWHPEFKDPLRFRPQFELTQLKIAAPHCDACHLGGRVSTLVGRVSGSKYDRYGFEDIDSSSDESEDSDQSSASNAGRKKEFYLGKFCARRARVFHEFSHWEYNLFSNILEKVDNLRANLSGKSSFVTVKYYGNARPPKDLSDPDAIVEYFDQCKFIDEEWQIIRDMMDSAQNLESAAKRGADRDD